MNSDQDQRNRNQTNQNAERNSQSESAPEQQQHQSGYTVIRPNETRRNDLTMVAQSEVERLKALREAQRSAPVHIDPQRVGGNGTMAEAREQQFRKQRSLKSQKRLKMEEEKKRKKEEEERENQIVKDKAREQAEKQAQKREKEDISRKKKFDPDRQRCLERYERNGSSSTIGPLEQNTPSPDARDMPKVKTEQEKRMDHERRNATFLDKIEQQMKNLNGGGESPEPICSGSSAGGGATNTVPTSGPDFEWALMKLMRKFPSFDKDFLGDILGQFNGDFEQASALLSE
ncbi:unnamed protein product [Knipowitschia caucasica]